MMKFTDEEIRESSLITGSGLIGAFMGVYINQVIGISFPYNMGLLVIVILFVFVMTLWFVRKLPKKALENAVEIIEQTKVKNSCSNHYSTFENSVTYSI